MGAEFRLLGAVEARIDGRLVDIGHARQRCVLVALLVEVNRVVSMDQLIDRVWGELPPPGARGTLHGYLSRLRRIFSAAGDVALERRPGGYVASVDPMAVDVHRFHILITQARAADDDEAAGVLFEQALREWRGEALTGLDTPWGNAVRDALNQQRLAARLDRTDLALRYGRHDELLGDLMADVVAHPLNERLIGQLLLALYRSGRQAEALETYRNTRRVFTEELGIDPGPALQELETAILAHDRALDWSRPSNAGLMVGSESTVPPMASVPVARAVGGSGTRARVWNVPGRNPRFIGRAALVDELCHRLRPADTTLIVQALYGMGGAGKTHLAIEYAHRHHANYRITWWVDSEQPALIPNQFAALAKALGIRVHGDPMDTVRLVLDELAHLSCWLLIFDNAERPEDIAQYLPSGSGHVMVTSRFPGWGALGGRLEVGVFARQDTVALLRGWLPDMAAELAEDLATELGDLPLAAAQAASYLEQTGMPPSDYLHRFRNRRVDLLARGDVLGYKARVDTAWELSLERLTALNPAAVALLELAAFLAPEPIPFSFINDHSELLDGPLRTIAGSPDELADAVGAAVAFSLALRHSHGFQLHRLVQAVIRHRLSSDRRARVGAQAVGLLAAAHPGDPNDPAHWAAYARLAPHVLTAGDLGDDNRRFRRLIVATITYLNVGGDSKVSRLLAEEILTRWQRDLGSDHPDTLRLAATLTFNLLCLGKADEARALGQGTLEQAHHVLGADHHVTLLLAAHVTFALAWQGHTEQARAVGQDALDRARRILGPDHPITLVVATNLAFALAWLGLDEQSRDLGREALDRSRRVLGADHPLTLFAATNLAFALAWLGDTEEAHAVGQQTLDHARRSIGPNHLITLLAASSHTFTQIRLGESQRARHLGQDTLERSLKLLGTDHQLSLVLATNLTIALLDTGDTVSAQVLGQDTLQRSNRVLGGDHRITLTLRRILGDHPEDRLA